jgi:hypothetical protein
LRLRAALLARQGLVLELEARLDGNPGATEIGVDLPAPATATAQLRETRRIKGPGLVYFDHPEFGVLAVVRSLASTAAAIGPTVPASGDTATAPPR